MVCQRDVRTSIKQVRAALRFEHMDFCLAQLRARHRNRNRGKCAIQQMTQPEDRFVQVSSVSDNSGREVQNEGRLSEPLTLILCLLLDGEFVRPPMPEHRGQNASRCNSKNEKPNGKMRVH